ncbi:AraC family transcriptional regulator [Mucilaginibacter sp. CAU 1740]|uniref:helix-turn-helix domain-containing protein n=1 Tax=Mucilaginibacter sp. CAU 1740 TaxID=3140365 RepID=UPI00325A73FD
MEAHSAKTGILISCYYKKSVKGENIIRQHAFACQLSGSLLVRDGKDTALFNPGDFRFNVRNKLARFIKQPAGEQPFRSISLQFDEDVLREFAKEQELRADAKMQPAPSIRLKKHPLLQNFMDSLQHSMAYFESGNRELVKLKLKEALLVLLQVHPELKNILFDFDPPGKINLKAFMEQNFRYNLSVERLAYLTGRSISGFKRDFFKEYGSTPAKWLQEKRLTEAHYLLTDKRMRVTEVYADLGFEDLSHFSFVFKKRFGLSPAALKKHRNTK